MNLKCIVVTSMAWMIGILAFLNWMLINQVMILPNQDTFMQVKNSYAATPTDFTLEPREPAESDMDKLDRLVHQASQ